MRFLLVLPFLAGCAYQPHISLGGGVRRVNGDNGLVGCLGAGQRLTERTSWEWKHCSDPTKGNPVNDEYDVSHDSLTIEHRWGGK